MKVLIVLLLAMLLFVLLVRGTALSLVILLTEYTGTLAYATKISWVTYFTATLIDIGLLWLFVKMGSRK